MPIETHVRVGDLDTRLAIQAATETQNEFGEPIETWTTLAYRWAHVEPLSTREYVQAAALQSQATHEITMRYNTLVDHKSRLMTGARIFHVAQVFNESERSRWLRLLCREEVS